MSAIIELIPEGYSRHLIHGPDRCWTETNCYADVLIELIHALGHEPIAALPFTLTIDFEIDQWTFFKFPHSDLLRLFGMEIQELNPWISLIQHIEHQISAGRPILVEVDSFYLPDTSGTTYQTEHAKSTIAINEIDSSTQQLGYFHGQGYYHLNDQDFRDIFQIDGPVNERILPPYVELVKLHNGHNNVSTDHLVRKSIEALRDQLSLLPSSNPFTKFQIRFIEDLKWLQKEPIDVFHKYSFATLRQYGACFELSSTYLSWLDKNGENGLSDSIADLMEISRTAKTLQFKLARSLAKQKTLDLTPIDLMGELWHRATQSLIALYG